MADITFRSFSSKDSHAVNAIDPGKPTGTASTDVLVAVMAQGAGNPTLTAPTNWTAIFAQQQTASGGSVVTTRCWQALGNVASTNFTSNSTLDTGIVILAFQNVDNTTPIDATGTANSNTGSSSLTANAVTTVTDRALYLVACADWLSGTVSSSGFTVKENGTPPPSNEMASVLFKNTVTTPIGSTGTCPISDSASATGQIIIAMPFALRPAASAAKPSAGYEDGLNTLISNYW